jgi:hypothetical protein
MKLMVRYSHYEAQRLVATMFKDKEESKRQLRQEVKKDVGEGGKIC